MGSEQSVNPVDLQTLPPPASRCAWEDPTLTHLGSAADLLQGTGKKGSVNDGDAMSTFKSPGL